MATKLKEMAKLAYKRLATGFWQDENNRRQQSLTALAAQGGDTADAKRFFVESTKQQCAIEYDPAEENAYQRVRSIFLAGNGEMALSALIDQEEIQKLDDSGRQRYIFNLSAKLQEYRERFEKEQKYAYQGMSL